VKIYVAGKWEQRGVIGEHIRILKCLGYQVTHNWTNESDEGLEGENRTRYLQTCAADDLEGVLRADVLLVFHHPGGQGLFVEVGAALATRRIPVLVLGDDAGRTPIFYTLPQVKRLQTWDEVLRELARLAEEPGDEGCF
jgi:hypothetical protein